jgi:hypothetical protein
MNTPEHSEYASYLKERSNFNLFQQAIDAWIDSGEVLLVEAYSFAWSYNEAKDLTRSLSQMMQAYNCVLYEQLPYCAPCGGRCCGVGAVHVSRFDLLALALLDLQYPDLSNRTQISARDCIYQTFAGCSWPAEWRTMKCWLFYCLGDGDWNLTDAVDKRYQEVARNLEPVVAELLPAPVRRYGEENKIHFDTNLCDPLKFAHQLESALDDILAIPLLEQYGYRVSQQIGEYKVGEVGNEGIHLEALLAEERISRLIAEIVDQLEIRPEIDLDKDQIFADLERIEWIGLGKPHKALDLLEQMKTRYKKSNDGEDDLIIQKMRVLIKHMQDKLWVL